MAETMNMVAKRALESSTNDLDDEDDTTAVKRIRTLQSPTVVSSVTEQTYQAFADKYGLAISFQQFLALAGYLCTILQWGYEISETDLDSFIHLYSTYEVERSRLEILRMSTPTTRIPAYHQWFTKHNRSLPRQAQDAVVLNEQILRRIWGEHPHTFLRVNWRLKAISKRAREVKRQREDAVHD